MKFVYIIPTGGFLVALAFIGGFQQLNDYSPDPDDITPYTSYDYERKAEAYAERGDREKALDTCAVMETGEYSEHDIEFCRWQVYDVLDDTDELIKIYEKQLAEELADGDSGALTKRGLERLYKEQEQKK